MKILYNLLVPLFFILYSLFNAPTASAHLAGQPPFFKINGQYSNLYPVPTTSLADFNLPQDLAAENYLVNQQILFEFDISQLPVTPQALADTKFFWDFGDGTSGTGLKNTHSYTKIGSYLVVINAQYQTEQPQLLQSTLINVLPNKDYQLPQAIIKVNGQRSSDPLTDIIHLSFKDPLQFDATESKSSSQITAYLWDFGDSQSGNQAKMTHQYNTSQVSVQLFPVLRITDQYGFLADTFVEVENQDITDQHSHLGGSNSGSQPNILERLKVPFAIFWIIALLGMVFYIRKRK